VDMFLSIHQDNNLGALSTKQTKIPRLIQIVIGSLAQRKPGVRVPLSLQKYSHGWEYFCHIWGGKGYFGVLTFYLYGCNIFIYDKLFYDI
jgi:hypothetical protein